MIIILSQGSVLAVDSGSHGRKSRFFEGKALPLIKTKILFISPGHSGPDYAVGYGEVHFLSSSMMCSDLYLLLQAPFPLFFS